MKIIRYAHLRWTEDSATDAHPFRISTHGIAGPAAAGVQRNVRTDVVGSIVTSAVMDDRMQAHVEDSKHLEVVLLVVLMRNEC